MLICRIRWKSLNRDRSMTRNMHETNSILQFDGRYRQAADNDLMALILACFTQG